MKKLIILLLSVAMLASCSKSKEEVARLLVDSLYRVDFSDELQRHYYDNYQDDMLKGMKAGDQVYVYGKLQKAYEDRKGNIKDKIRELQGQ